jgi:hypothetical protein
LAGYVDFQAWFGLTERALRVRMSRSTTCGAQASHVPVPASQARQAGRPATTAAHRLESSLTTCAGGHAGGALPVAARLG